MDFEWVNRITKYEVRRKAEFLASFQRINTYKNKKRGVV
nr:MAG TPA: hypothetical protein [Caudoviricetes sp.]